MKKQVLLAVALLAAMACSREQQVQPRLVEWSFNAKASTKGVINAQNEFSWEPGDKIGIWNAADESFVEFTSLAGKGVFSAMAPENARFLISAFHPASIAAGTGSVNLPASYDSPDAATALIPMHAPVQQDNNALVFRHVCALMQITVNHVTSDLNRVVIHSEGNALSGNFTLTTDSGNKVAQVKYGSGDITVNFTMDQAGTLRFTIPVPVGAYSFSITLGGDANPEALVISSSYALNFGRANLYRLTPFDYLTERYAIVGYDSMEIYTLENDSANWQL